MMLCSLGERPRELANVAISLLAELIIEAEAGIAPGIFRQGLYIVIGKRVSRV